MNFSFRLSFKRNFVMKKNILIICALSVELKIVKEQIKQINYKNVSIKYLLTWVGNYNTIYNLKSFLSTNVNPDFIINFWVVWKTENSSNDFFQVYRVFNWSNNNESIIPIYIKKLALKSLLSSEKVVTLEKDLLWEEYVDMESYWINYITSKEKIPLILIKKPFDTVWIESNKVSLELLKNDLKLFDYGSLIKDVDLYLEKNKDSKNIDLSFYKDYFKFTFSEFEIFKKNYNKLIAYDISFELFFTNNKELNKKDFLSKIDKI